MCSRGVFQLRKLSIFFCDYGGSSNGVRQAMTSQSFKNFMKQNPQIQFNFICKRNHHPFVRGAYINGYTKEIPLRNEEQQKIQQAVEGLRNQLGRKSFKASGKRVFGGKQSIQGKWQPNIFNKYPLAELEKQPNIPEIPTEKEEKKIEEVPKGKSKDIAANLVNLEEWHNPFSQS